jgi:hypothetical protein
MFKNTYVIYLINYIIIVDLCHKHGITKKTTQKFFDTKIMKEQFEFFIEQVLNKKIVKDFIPSQMTGALDRRINSDLKIIDTPVLSHDSDSSYIGNSYNIIF